jgi:hypothetical protein
VIGLASDRVFVRDSGGDQNERNHGCGMWHGITCIKVFLSRTHWVTGEWQRLSSAVSKAVTLARILVAGWVLSWAPDLPCKPEAEVNPIPS